MAIEPNPNPARITDPMWRLWTERPDQTWRLGGIYADKRCYHNTVTANLVKWPDAYCVQLPLDLVPINRDKARAIDYTMSTEKIILYTKRLQAAALHPEDNRLNALREFYGTLDGKTVYGLIQDKPGGPWKFSSSTLSHLWHIHESFFTQFVNDWSMLRPTLSVLGGQSWDNWKEQEMQVTSLSPAALEQIKNYVLWEGANRSWTVPGRTLGGTTEAIWNNTSARLAEVLKVISENPNSPVRLEPEQIPLLAELMAELLPSSGTFIITTNGESPEKV